MTDVYIPTAYDPLPREKESLSSDSVAGRLGEEGQDGKYDGVVLSCRRLAVMRGGRR